jgi:PrgI family protein
MRFEVPQFIEIEDKIFGPFTWKQFVYLAGGVGLGTVLFFTLPIFFFIILGLPLGGLAVMLAFYPINNRPFSFFLEAMVRFYRNHRVYYWRKKSTIVYRESSPRESTQVYANLKKNVDINSLSRKLELNELQK